MIVGHIHFGVQFKKRNLHLLSDPIIENYNNQMDQLVRRFRVIEVLGQGRAIKKWICKEAEAKYIFLKTELQEYIEIHYPNEYK
ncbi:hypothetical protein PBAC_24290 [Pedobacter glucosidilyticus]|uniref:Uncharacterized protein n=1 Tax=Pedobacter aquae TaxID=2605747 RepID=A0A5C0VJ05_9SPHI|nr:MULTISPECIES: hypothetical protein [Pedobacter]KHJ37361.1 hypothetical protein PBAC_24290 [Pedobacter glucosidilyticus]QEK51812.1 hypothetical protein FYC62_09255 [Pedobacter aquae]